MDKHAWGFLESSTSRFLAALKSADAPRPSINLIEWASPPAPAEESHAGPQGSMGVSALALKGFHGDDAAHMSGWSPLGCISQRPLGLMVRHTFSIDLQVGASRVFVRSTNLISGRSAGRESHLAKTEEERDSKLRDVCVTQRHSRDVAHNPSFFFAHSSPFFPLQRYFFLDKGILKYGKSIADVSTKTTRWHDKWPLY